MGGMKNLMMDIQNANWQETTVDFQCPHCNINVEGRTELPVIDDINDQHDFPVSIICTHCQTDFDCWAKTDWSTCTITLNEHPKVAISAQPVCGYLSDYDDYDREYYEQLIKEGALGSKNLFVFCENLKNIDVLCNLNFDYKKSQMLMAMLLVQSITALEVYLADVLIQNTANSLSVQKRLLNSKVLQIGDMSFNLKDAAGTADFAKEKLIKYLRNVSFHDLDKVKKFFEIGLCISIVHENDKFEILKNAVRQRHDFVHRNGKERDTAEEIEIFSDTILDLTENLREFATCINEKIESGKHL